MPGNIIGMLSAKIKTKTSQTQFHIKLPQRLKGTKL
jgi:hypothetical protein